MSYPFHTLLVRVQLTKKPVTESGLLEYMDSFPLRLFSMVETVEYREIILVALLVSSEDKLSPLLLRRARVCDCRQGPVGGRRRPHDRQCDY